MCFLLTVLVLFSFTGCDDSETVSGEYEIYYFNMDKTKIEPEEYDSTGATGEVLVKELLLRLQSEPHGSKLRRTIPENISVLGVKSSGVQLTVDFSQEYSSLSVAEEVLIRAAVVRTLLQCPEYSLVNFTVNSEPLKTKDGSLVGNMTMIVLLRIRERR